MPETSSTHLPEQSFDPFSEIREGISNQSSPESLERYRLLRAIDSLRGHLYLDVFCRKLLPETPGREKWVSVSVDSALTTSFVSKESAEAYRPKLVAAARAYVDHLLG